MRRLLLSTLTMLLFSVALSAQTKITGKITNSSDGTPIIGATVLARESMRATATDKDGNYSLTLSPVDKFIDVTYIGMQNDQTPVVKGKTNYNFAMKESFNNLEEVIVVGYGTQLKRDVTGAITSLTAAEIEQNSGGNLNTALQGKVPGLSIVTTSGEPGAGANVTIRGASSINGSTEPLYIIDGVPVETSNVTSIDGDATFSPIAGINPNDIESVEVLKDAASAAIYGSRAANGVIIITTKGGQKLGVRPPTISVGHTSSIVTNSRNLDVLNGTQFREIYMESRINQAARNGDTPSFDGWVTNPYNPLVYRSTDWQDLMFRTTYQSRTDVSVSGSSENFSYSVSLGYRDLKPTIIYTDYNQLNTRANFTYKITKAVKGYTSVSYSKQDYRRVLTGNSNLQSVVSTVVKSNPCFYPYDPQTGELLYFIGKFGGDSGTRNPMALARDVPNNFERDWMVLTQYFDFTLYKGLTLRVQGSMESDQSVQQMYTPRVFDSTNGIDKGAYQNNLTRRFLSEDYLSYSYKSKDKRHNLNAVLGMSIQKDNGTTFRLDGQDYVDSKVIQIQGAARYTNLSQTYPEKAQMSFFTRVNYSYHDKYIMSATLRRDGSSRFGANNRWGYFPAASVGWRISSEKFMDWAQGWLQDAKLRFSWGQTGNQSIGNYAWRGSYEAGSTRYDGNSVILYTAPANYNLGWETTTQYNAGLDLSLFGGRVAFTFDAYKKVSDNLLVNLPISYYTGFSSIPKNFGSIENKGLEFLLETVNITKGKFKWRSSFNLSLNRSKVLSLPSTGQDDLVFGGISLARVGEPVGVFYTYKALGIYPSDADNVYTGKNAALTKGKYVRGYLDGEPFKGGDVMWYDADGNGVIDDADRVLVGDPNPKFIGGFGNIFSYKQWSLNVFLQFSYGGQILNDFRRDRNSMSMARNTGQDMLRRWQNQGDITDRPRVEYADYMGNFRQSSLWLEDASYLRLKDVTLSYNIKLKKSFVKNVKLQFTAANLLTWSKYSGYDPEVNTSSNPFVQGIDNGAFPKARSYNFGVNLTF